jgi:tetratricopeptide (TPR) repeat protein
VFPVNLAVFYPLDAHISRWRLLGAVAGLMVISVMAALNARKRPYVAAGWLWYLVTLVPVIGLVNIGFHSSADRYTYIPLVGIFVACAWLLSDFLAGRKWKAWGGVGSVLVLLLLSAISCNQVRYWKNDATLFRHAEEVTTGNWVAHQHLSTSLLKEMRLKESYDQIQKALRINPGNANNYFILADIDRAMKRPEDALRALEKGVLLDPANARGVQSLGVMYANAGRVQDAERVLLQLEMINPDYANELEKYLRFSAAVKR